MSVIRTINSIGYSNLITINSIISGFTDPTQSNIQDNISEGSGQWNFNGTTGPVVTAKYSGLITLSTGAFTLDLTNLTDFFLGSGITMSGLKLRFWQLFGSTTNANAITAQVGASNGYTGLNGKIVVGPGDYGSIGPIQAVNGVSIDGTHKTIDFSGTGAQTCQIVALFG